MEDKMFYRQILADGTVQFLPVSKTTRIEQWVATVEIAGDINLVEVHLVNPTEPMAMLQTKLIDENGCPKGRFLEALIDQLDAYTYRKEEIRKAKVHFYQANNIPFITVIHDASGIN